MDINMYLKFLGSNFVFSFCTILIGFTLSYILYDKIVTRGIGLKDALFVKDNFSAWLEFTGAFILPILYISAKALAGSSSVNMWLDLLISLGYVVTYVILFTLLRLCSSLVVRLLNFKDERGVVRLNDEIYTQSNNAAAIFSIALSVIFVNIVSFFDPHPEYIVASLLKISVVLLINLAAVTGYLAVLGRKTTLAQEIFKDNNTASAVEFLGFIFSVQMIMNTYFNLKEAISFSETLVVTLISLAVFGVLSGIFNVLFAKILKIDIWDEIYHQNNVGAALGRVALYAGIGFIIVNYIS